MLCVLLVTALENVFRYVSLVYNTCLQFLSDMVLNILSYLIILLFEPYCWLLFSFKESLSKILFLQKHVIGGSGNTPLKLESAIFIKFLFFHQMIALQNYEKCFLFHLKSSFHSRDIQFFVFLSFPLFLPVGHCFRG